MKQRVGEIEREFLMDIQSRMGALPAGGYQEGDRVRALVPHPVRMSHHHTHMCMMM